MIHQNDFEGHERIFRYKVELAQLNMYEMNVLARHPERPYLLPILREKDEDVHLIYALNRHLTLDQWIRRSASNYHDLLSMLEEIIGILNQAVMHGLRINRFVLEPSRICYDHVKKHIALLYLPLNQTEISFERQWLQMIHSLESIAAMSLTTEGKDIFEALVKETTCGGERHEALLKTIKAWFAFVNRPDSQRISTDELSAQLYERYQKAGMNPMQKKIDTISEASSDSAHLNGQEPVAPPLTSKRFWKWSMSDCLSKYFKINPMKKHHIIAAGKDSLNSTRPEAFEKPQSNLSPQRKAQYARFEFEGTSLLSGQEQLQGKLILQNQQSCRIFELNKPVTRIGRNTSLCDVIVENDITVGRLHAEVHKMDQSYYIKDLDSLNGTFLNDQRLDAQTLYKLRENDRLRLSELEIHVI